jgi:ATP-dependent helicase/nuclease subunit A
MPQLTPEQHTAIHTRDVSVALSAGAGCGKTFVLTERFITHLLPQENDSKPARLSQLVAITFTDAAAREMRSRIRGACYEQLTHAESAEEQAHWQRLLREIDSARVSTIHAFCAALLRTHAAAAGLDPLFGVIDQSDADVLQLDVIDDVLRTNLARLDPETLDLASAYGLSRLKQQISALIHHRHEESFHDWFNRTPDEMIARWRRWHEEKAFPLAVREIAALAPIHRLIEQLQDADCAEKKPAFAEARAALLDLLPRLLKLDVTHNDLQNIREVAKVGGVCTAKDWGSAEAYNEYRDACKELRDAIDDKLAKPFDADAARTTAELGLALLRLTHQVAEQYDRRKSAQGKLDFDDLLFRTHQFLTETKNAALRKQISDDLRLLLVDEFQDTDKLQAQLVRVLCGEGFDVGRLFFVGDFKQSIYRFRGAEPGVFRDLRAQMQETGRLPLTLNFRSQPGILDFVNALFCDALHLEGEEYQALRASRPQTTSAPCVEFLWTITPDKKKKSIAGSALEARRLEARNIARRIRNVLDAADGTLPVVDDKTKQPRVVRPGDIAILFRTLSDVQVYEEALREYELDYYLVGGHAFYAQQEIYDVLNLLRTVASTADEVSLAGVLRSPFFSLADETLFWLADTTGSLNAGLLAGGLPKQLSPEECAKALAAANTIGQLRAIKDRVPIATLLAHALDRTGYDAALLTEFLGQRKLANLHKLMERARAADHGGVIDLDGFITQLAQFIAQQPKESLAATLPEAADVIRLMTIHHAKGLEFPLVILPDLDRQPHFGSVPAAFDPEFGPLVPAPADDEEQKNVATGMSIFNALERAEELEERKRLLYVAATRAADYLILSSSLESHATPISDWTELLAERFDLETGELIVELPPGYTAPQVRVEPEQKSDVKPVGRSRGPDVLKLLDNAHQLAADGDAIVPPEVAPIVPDASARRQFSFSSLGNLFTVNLDEQAAVSSPPKTHRADSRQAQALGTLTHELLARIDFKNPETIRDECEYLAAQLLLPNVDETCRVGLDMVQRFAASPRGKQLAIADAIHRELEFLLAWPSGDSSTDPTYFRGYLDCLYQDRDGRWRLLDYKTDNIAAADVARYAERYAMQLYVYALAAERALGEPPAELALYFLRPGVEHIFPWNDSIRRQALENVNSAITRAVTFNADQSSDGLVA